MYSRAKNYGAINSDPEVGFAGGTSSQERNEVTNWNRMCEDIETNIYTINSSLKTLEGAIKTIGTPKDNEGLRKTVHVVQLSTNQIAVETTKTLALLKSKWAIVGKQRQLQVEKFEDIFKEALNKYHLIQKELVIKQKANLLPSPIDYEDPQDGDQLEYQQKQSQLARDIAFEQEMLLEREARVKQIEADVLDINEIVRELGSMVHDQGEHIDTIENNIDSTAMNVEQGTKEVSRAAAYQNKYRKKLVYLVIILIIVACILVAVIWSSLKGSGGGGHSNSTKVAV